MPDRLSSSEATPKPSLEPILKIDWSLNSAEGFDELVYTHAITNELSLWNVPDLMYLQSQDLTVLSHEAIVREVIATILEQRDKEGKAAVLKKRPPSPYDQIWVTNDQNEIV